jgi:hypothetical protein
MNTILTFEYNINDKKEPFLERFLRKGVTKIKGLLYINSDKKFEIHEPVDIRDGVLYLRASSPPFPCDEIVFHGKLTLIPQFKKVNHFTVKDTNLLTLDYANTNVNFN